MHKLILCAAMALILCLSCAAAGAESYASAPTVITDGWYPRSTGGAELLITADGGHVITGRTMDWNSPGHDFDLVRGVKYTFSVQIMQSDLDEASFMISVAHTLAGAESYENLGFGTVPKGEWTTVTGSYVAGDYEKYCIYIETAGAPTLEFAFRDFTIQGEETTVPEAEIPALKDVYAGLFDFGTAVTYPEAVDDARMAFYRQQFNSMTPGNELKPDSVLDVKRSRELSADDPTAVAVHFDAARPLLDFCRDNGVKLHGHVLVWHNQTPEAFFHEGYNTFSPWVSREVMLGRLENYIRLVMEYMGENYPGVVVSWDVVNEAIDDQTGELRTSMWTRIVGDDYIERAFEYARKYAPEGTLLYYNDYNTALEPKQTGIVKLLETLAAQGTIDGYGFQMHHDVAFPSMSQIEHSLERVAALGLRLRVSELDVTVPDNTEASFERQAGYYAGVMRLILKYQDQMDAVQVWGVTDDLSWRARQFPLLFDADFQPKPAFWAVIEEANAE